MTDRADWRTGSSRQRVRVRELPIRIEKLLTA
jgi:hypothetical protein